MHRSLTTTSLMFVLAVTLAACGTPTSPAVRGVTISVPGGAVFVGDEIQASAVVDYDAGADPSLAWVSTDNGVATVSSAGLITAVGEGMATITAFSVTDADKQDSVILTVDAHPLEDRTVLYYVDVSQGTDVAGSALTTAAADYGLVVTTAGNDADFLDEITNGYDLVVLMIQSVEPSVAMGNAVVAHVASGGYLAFATWTDAEAGDTIFAALQTSLTGEWNLTDLEILDQGLLAGLGDSALTVTNSTPHYVFSLGLIADEGAEALAHYTDGGGSVDAIVLGNEGRTAAIGFLADSIEPVDGETLYLNLFSKLMRHLADSESE